jgi:hypothetical protein
MIMSRKTSSRSRSGAFAISFVTFLAISALGIAFSWSLAPRAAGADNEANGAGATSAQDKYTLKVPGGLAFSEFKGYENWSVVAISENGGMIAVILANRVMIDAYRAGFPGNGKPFPEGSKMAKVHWSPKKNESYPGQPIVPGTQHDVDFMVKDSNRFADSGGWGWAEFEYDASSDTFRPGTLADKPPQGNDAKCGFACHTVVKTRDYVFTDYGKR